MTAASQQALQGTDRLHALDAVRAYALLLGVVLHAAAAFLEGFPVAVWAEEPSPVAAGIYYVIHMFRMSAFFLIAGFFARMVVERRGVAAFAKDRGKRIAIPLFGFGPVVIASIVLGFALGALTQGVDNLQAATQQTNATQEAITAAQGDQANVQPNFLVHLWFLYYLLIFYVLALVLRWAVRAADGNARFRGALDRLLAIVMRGVWAPVIIALPLIGFFLASENWNEWIGLPAPFSLIPETDALFGYGLAFGLGWLLHRQIPLLLNLRGQWVLYLLAAIGLTVVCLRIGGLTPVWSGSSLEGSERTVYTVAYMVAIWCWIFAFVGAAVRFLSSESRVNRYLADASYWIYLMHMTTIVFFITALRPFDWHWSIKFAVYVLGSMPILLVSYHYLVRFTWIGAVLNGRRHPKPARKPPQDAARASA